MIQVDAVNPLKRLLVASLEWPGHDSQFCTEKC